MGCQAFYQSSIRASNGNAWLEVANDSGVLTIKKEYVIGMPNRSNPEITENVQSDDWELADDEDHEVRIIMVSSIRA